MTATNMCSNFGQISVVSAGVPPNTLIVVYCIVVYITCVYIYNLLFSAKV